MVALLLKFPHTAGRVLDVGSYDVNGTYKPMFGTGYKYEGLDIMEGPNVDIVATDPYKWPIEDNTYDVIISGSCLEHVEAPWLWIDEVYRVCKPGGLCVIQAPWKHGIHRHPVDCWRILPDAMIYLLSKRAKFEVLDSGLRDDYIGDCWGVGRKPL
jgi:SAM-dependent methyltransferase